MLKEFARYLKTLDPQSLAAEQIKVARRLDLPLMRLFKDVPEAQMIKLARDGVETLLDDFMAGRALEAVRASLEQWERGEMPGISPEALTPADLILSYLAQKQTLLHFLPGFSQDPDTIIQVVIELSEYVARAQLIAIDMLMHVRDQEAARLVRLEASQQATQQHLEEMQAANEELQTQQAELEALTNELTESKGQLEAELGRNKRIQADLAVSTRRAEESSNRMAFLAEAGLVLSSSLDYETTLAKVAQLAVPKIADWATVQMLEDGTIKQLAVAHVNPAKVAWALELQKRFPQNPDDPNGPMAQIRSGKPQLFPEIPQALIEALPPDQREVLDELGLVSSMSVPILVRGQAIGLITFVSAESGKHYDDNDLAFAQELARRAASAIENARLYHEAQEAERELRELNTTLEKRVAERTGLLEATNKELEAFSYSVSHDLRAPLRAIDGFSQAMEEDYADKVDDTGKDYLHRIRAASQRMAQLIEDLLSFSRLTRGVLEHEKVDLGALARDVIAGLQQGQPERQVEWVIPEGLEVEGDPRLLRVVLDNLLSNAFKFTSHHATARIELARSERDGRPAYCVKDNGAGFDMAYAGKLFTPFQRLHTTNEFPGTGIGLATVQRIVHRHGGRIWAEAAPEKGASFCFTLS